MSATVTVRVRSMVWFATGAALSLVVTLLFVNAWRADAAPGDTDATFVPVTPCRLFDFRPPPDNVGPKSSPLGPGETHLQQVTGDNGNCVGIPASATAVAMNVTIVNPTAQSNLRLFPGDVVTPPLVSNLNWLPGQSPTPNKVDVKLSTSGTIKLLNLNGTVNVIGDVVGYYTNSSLVEIHNRLAALEGLDAGNRLTALETAEPFAVHASGNQAESVTATDEVVRSVTVTAPAAGTVTVVSSHEAIEPTSYHGVRCSITTGTDLDLNHEQYWQSPGVTAQSEQMAGTRGFSIAAGDTVTYNLVCDHFGGGAGETSGIRDSSLTAIFTPDP